MTSDEMLAYAKSIVDGGPVKKAEVQAFMKALLEQAAPAEPEPDLQAGSLGMTREQVLEALPVLPFEIERTDTGMHLPREANRYYTRREAAALVAAIGKALDITK